MNQHLSQKPSDFQNDDIKNNNNTLKSNVPNGTGLTGGLDGLSIFQNTLHSYNTLQKLSMPQPQTQHQELYQLNQELLNRLKNLSMGYQTPLQTPVSTTSFTPSPTTGLPSFPTDSNFMFTNAATQNFTHNNNNNLNNNSSINMVASSPLGTLNRSSSTYSTMSPIGDSFDRSLDNINNNNISSSNESPFIKPLSQVGTVTTLDNDGKVKVLVPVEQSLQHREHRERSVARVDDDYYGGSDKRTSGGTLQKPQKSQPIVLTPILSRGEKRNQSGNTVTLKVTDEAGNVTNQRKLPAQPLMITRSTSEKVPNRSQMMSHVQRTQWARHTTK
jgi:carboxyl-terminal PDZ ligand of neuronal nitric oxide synthase protein